MQKRIWAALAAALLALSLSACAAKGPDTGKLEKSTVDSDALNASVALYIKQKTVTDESTEVALILINATDTDFSYDAVQRLEVLNDGEWYVVPDKQEGVVLILNTLPAGAAMEDMFYFEAHYDKLTHGTYRIVKRFTAEDGTVALAAAEFDIR